MPHEVYFLPLIPITDFIEGFADSFFAKENLLPWQLTEQLSSILQKQFPSLSADFKITDGVAIHHTAIVEEGAVIKGPAIISEHCFVSARAYVRGGVYLGAHSIIGPGVEIKTCIIFNHSCIAHLNFIGDSIIGNRVNFEAGSVCTNHHNEREDKVIHVLYRGTVINTGVLKFGSLVGDHSKVGANAVLFPGTLLPPYSIVKRLELVEQAVSR